MAMAVCRAIGIAIETMIAFARRSAACDARRSDMVDGLAQMRGSPMLARPLRNLGHRSGRGNRHHPKPVMNVRFVPRDRIMPASLHKAYVDWRNVHGLSTKTNKGNC
jgi:hypothetical protein